MGDGKNPNEGFASNLRGLRAMRGLSQAELAEMVHVDVSSVQKWERGMHMPNLATTMRLADALKCDIGLLAGHVSLLDAH